MQDFMHVILAYLAFYEERCRRFGDQKISGRGCRITALVGNADRSAPDEPEHRDIRRIFSDVRPGAPEVQEKSPR
jgi:hypothetical protein